MAPPSDAGELKVGFAETDITPDVKGPTPVWLAGYGMGRRATGVHDPLIARCIVLDDGQTKFAFCSVDLVGLQYPEVKKIRAKLSDFGYVMVSSSHNHERPDVIGIWGRSPLHRGVDDAYIERVVEQVVAAVRVAQEKLLPAVAEFGMAEDESLVNDSRQPIVKDGVIRVIKLSSPTAKSAPGSDGNKKVVGLIVQWSCHPEALGSENTLVTADFPSATVAALKAKYDCPIAYFSGAVGGLMAPPRGRVKSASGAELKEGDFEYARVYGEAVAQLADQAIAKATKIELTPLRVAAREIVIPVDNKVYRAARSIGVFKRRGYHWSGEPADVRPLSDAEDSPSSASSQMMLAVASEVTCVACGELAIACIPGEIYPELVYGKFQEPVEPNADFPDAPLEPSIAKILDGRRWMIFGLANDELGYIIPKRQWDELPPYAYGRDKSQYGEINSCGPRVAPIIMHQFQLRATELFPR